jgi:hypothetical protein
VATLLYYIMWSLSAPFWAWAVVSVLIGLGFTFFSGAVEAWLVRRAASQRVHRPRSRRCSGVADGHRRGDAGRLGLGGVVAQATSLGVPFLIRVGVLLAMFVVAFRLMKDVGFTPRRATSPLAETRAVLSASLQHGLGNRPVRFVMLAAPFSQGVGIYVFYALQPFLLELYGDPEAYSVAGLAAAIVAGSQIAGGFAAPWVRGSSTGRTTAHLLGGVVSAGSS